MRGYPYPDNHKVHYILYGTRGLIAKGIVTRVRKGIFRVSDDPKAEEMLSFERELEEPLEEPRTQ